MKKIIVFILILACSYTANSEESPSIVLVRKSNGMLTLKVSSKTEGKIKVDWGNNNIQVYDVNAATRLDEATVIAEEVKRNIKIKIYGDDIRLFSCIDQFVTSLDIKQVAGLVYLNCSKNYLSKLDLSNNKALKSFNCSDNRIRELDFSNNTKIIYLTCSYNYLREISLGKNTSLQQLNIADNYIKTLNLIDNASLKNLNLNGNKLSEMNVKHLNQLRHLDLAYNKFSACELNKVFNDVPSISNEEKTEKKNLIINFNKGAVKSRAILATDKNWNLDIVGKGSAKCER